MITWSQFRTTWADEQRAAGLSPRTIDGRDAVLALLERTGKPPAAIEKADLIAVLNRPNARTGEPLSPGTKQVERSYMQTAFRWMLEEGHRDDDPAARLRKIRVPRRRPRPLTETHIEHMLDSGAYQSTRDMIVIGALTGLRIGEIVKIRGEDIDPITWTIRSLRKGGLSHVVWAPPAVQEIAARRGLAGWWFPSPYANRSYPNGGGHVLMKSASTSISRVLRKAGIIDPKITGHSLRHFYATTLLRQGVSVRVVQEMMGHASLATTQLYLEVTDDDQRAASNVLPFISPRARSARRGRPLAA